MAKRRLVTVFILIVGILIGAVKAESLSLAPDTVLVNGKVITVDASDSIAEALAIRDGKIVAIGFEMSILLIVVGILRLTGHLPSTFLGSPG